MATLQLPNGDVLEVPDGATQEQLQAWVDQLPPHVMQPRAAGSPEPTLEQKRELALAQARIRAEAEAHDAKPQSVQPISEKGVPDVWTH